MNRDELRNLGEQLRGIGHRRRELAERVSAEVREGDSQDSRTLYEELSEVTGQAISLMQRQRDILEQEISQLGGPTGGV
jgi:hypothetical protein